MGDKIREEIIRLAEDCQGKEIYEENKKQDFGDFYKNGCMDTDRGNAPLPALFVFGKGYGRTAGFGGGGGVENP